MAANRSKLAVAVDVGGAHADRAVGRELRRAAAPRHAGRLGDVGELAGVVAEQAVRVAVHVGDRHVEIAVLVEVEPHGADGPPRVGQADRRGDVGQLAGVVAIQRVGAIAEADEEIEIAVGVEVDPRRLADRAGRRRPSPRRSWHRQTMPALLRYSFNTDAALQRREAEQQIGIAVGIEVAPRRRARRPRVRHAGGRGHVGEHALVVAIQAIRLAVEADEHVEIAVVVVVGEGVGEIRPGAEHVRLHRLEHRQRVSGPGRATAPTAARAARWLMSAHGRRPLV